MKLKPLARKIMGKRLLQYTRDTVYSYKLWKNRNGIARAIKYETYRHIEMIMTKIKKLEKQHIVTLNGYRLFTIPNDTGISRELIVFKAHEPLSTKLLTKQLKKDMVCIDIGANIGYYALLESKITKRVIALEPSPLNYKILLDNIRLNNIQNIQPYNIAVGDRNGDTEFLISDRSNWSRIPQKIYTVEAYGQESVSSIKVPIVTLDSFIDKQKIDQVNFVRMDIEGYEYHALKGMHKTLEFRPLLQIEIHFQLLGINKTEAILKKLQDHGYETSYYIDHGIDMSIIGTSNDIEKSSITKIIQLLNSRTDHHAFHLLTSPEI